MVASPVTGGSVVLLDRTSYARPGKLFTANDSLIVREVGVLTPDALDELVTSVIALLRGEG